MTKQLDDWYCCYGGSVYRRCLRLCRDDDQAWDLLQETFLRAHRYQSSFRGESKPLSWLLTIADRCYLDTLRKRSPPELLERQEIEAFVRDEREGADVVFARQQLVTKLLAAVSEDLRAIAIARYFDELEHHEIADRLQINEKTVRRKIERFVDSAAKIARRL